MREIYSDAKRDCSILRLIESGAQVSDEELVSALLDGVCAVIDSCHTAKILLDKYGTLSNICNAPYRELVQTEGVGEKGAALLKICGAAVTNILCEGNTDNKRRIYTYDELVDYLRPHFLNQKVEKLYLLTLNSRYRILGLSLIAQGDRDSLTFDKKLVIDRALKSGASSVVLAHNHMSSVLPSAQDVIITNDLAQLLDSVSIRLHDHIIFCENKSKSMRRSGYIKDDKSPLFC